MACIKIISGFKARDLDVGTFIAQRIQRSRPRIRQWMVSWWWKTAVWQMKQNLSNQTDFYLFGVHALREGGVSFPLGIFCTPAILSGFYHLHTLQNTLLSFLSHRFYWDSPKQMPTNSVTAKDRRDNIQRKTKPCIHHLSCLVGIKYGLVWFMGKSIVFWKPL